MDNLIYDRSLQDVMTVLNKPNDASFLKGAFNYTDLNRIESYCKYIQDLTNEIQLLDENIQIPLKTNWKVTDFITLVDLNRIRNNVSILLEKLNVIGEEIEYTATLNYEQANALEKNLFLLKELFNTINREIKRCGTYYCGMGGGITCM